MPRPKKPLPPSTPRPIRQPFSPTRWQSVNWWFSEPANSIELRAWMDGPNGKAAMSVLWNSIPMDETQYKGYMLCLRTLQNLADFPGKPEPELEADFGSKEVLARWLGEGLKEPDQQ